MTILPKIKNAFRSFSRTSRAVGRVAIASIAQSPGLLRYNTGEANEEPLRAELIAGESLEEHARTLAEQHRVAQNRRGNRALFRRFEENREILEESYLTLSLASQNHENLTSGAEWLLDNHYIIQEQIREIRRDLPRGYYKTLPKLTEGEYRNYPRVYHIALEIISRTDGVIDSGLLSRFVAAYQSRSILTIGELWAVPIMLRIALIENLRRLAIRNVIETNHRKTAEALVQEITGSDSQAGTEILLMLARRLSMSPDFLTAGSVNLMHRLREHGSKTSLTLRWLEERLREQGHDPEEVARTEQHAQAANQISIGNTITSLRRVSGMNYREWVEGVSEIHKILLEDPDGAYGQSDFATRDHYRRQIERLARLGKKEEVTVAQTAIELASSTDHIHSHENNSQLSIARTLHVGYYLVDKGTRKLEERLQIRLPVSDRLARSLQPYAVPIYIGSIVTLTLAIMLRIGSYIYNVGGSLELAIITALLFAVPLSDLATSIFQWIATKVVLPTALPKLEFEKGVPENCRTIVAVHGIFRTREQIAEFISGIEVRFLANDDPNIFFALLADLNDAPQETIDGDQELIDYARQLMEELQGRHSVGRVLKPFYLLFRKREWNAAEDAFMGRERKRGKIEEFNRLLLGDDDTTFSVIVGDLQTLRSMKYVITLDSDSTLPRDVGRKLIGTIAHPLNRAVIDPKKNIVVEGYGIIQPRVGVSLTSARISNFSKIFATHAGLDPYTQMVSDVYQDLFAEGSYVGKAIYDINAFEQTLQNRVPENALLSHDLFEGCFARVALATDIEIFDDFPSCHEIHAKRLHRWVRGDWQLLPWIFRHIPASNGARYRSPLSALSRWKLLDNLRRSLVAPLTFICICLVCTILPGSLTIWLGLIAAIIAFPIFGTLANAAILPSGRTSIGGYLRLVQRDLFLHFVQAVISLSLLPYQTYLMVNAIVTALYRMAISKKNLLEWQVYSFSDFGKQGTTNLPLYLLPGLLITFLATIIFSLVAPNRILVSAAVALLWVASPFIVYWLGQQQQRLSTQLTANEKDKLLSVGWETWRYFDQHLTAGNNFLIPDNLQLVPNRVVAERTSPTNISLSILSVISAYDLGYISLLPTVDRLTGIFETLSKLERFHGHFLNWYQIKTLQSLSPRYISFVDSGNLVGHLIAARAAFGEFATRPFIGDHHRRHLKQRLRELSIELPQYGNVFRDAEKLLDTALSDDFINVQSVVAGLSAIARFIDEAQKIGDPTAFLEPDPANEFKIFIGELKSHLEFQPLLNWYQKYSENEDRIQNFLRDINAGGDQQVVTASARVLKNLDNGLPTPVWLEEIYSDFTTIVGVNGREIINKDLGVDNPLYKVIEELQKGYVQYKQFSDRCSKLKSVVSAIIDEIELDYLYDAEQAIFAIGFHVDSGTRDNSFYDLLASESRLGSFVAIATGQVPQKHWFSLDRTLVESPGGTALASWSATMFEYLMPLLVMRNYPRTLLSESYLAVVKAQQLYASSHGIPWGVSESAYSAVDFEKTYQYKAFGIPTLGLKRGLGDDFVVSPYSTFLALMVDPKESLKNIIELEKQGLRGEFGFYEAIDYTPERLSSDESSHIIESFLAHHQGMTLVALNNVLNSGIMQERFHSDPWVRATDLILQEKFPEALPMIVPKATETPTTFGVVVDEGMSRCERIATPHTKYPLTRVLSNGRYTVMIDNSGNGFSRMDQETALTRWREDVIAGQYGTYIFVKDLDDGKIWSVAYQPTRVEPDSYEVIFGPDKIEFKRRDFGIALHTEITVSPEDNVEVRRVTMTNLTSRKRNIELTSYAEVALSQMHADSAHPAFAKMFVESEYVPDIDGLIFSRRPRSKYEDTLSMMHMLTMKSVWAPTEYESSREAFLGRGNTIGGPAILSQNSKQGDVGAVLDPVYSLSTKIELEEGKTESAVFITGFAKSRDEILLLARRYHDLHSVTRAFEMAWSYSNVELRHEQFTIRQSHAFQRLAAALIYNIDSVRGPIEALTSNRLTQSGFWRFGVSGDLPIVLLRVNDSAQIKIVKELLLAHQYLRMRGIAFDLIILDEYPGDYYQAFHEEVEFLVRSGPSSGVVDRKGGVYLRSRVQLSAEEIGLLEAVARVSLSGAKRSLASQLNFDDRVVDAPRRKLFDNDHREKYPTLKFQKTTYEFPNGYGGFIADGKRYQIDLHGEELPPLPWSNIIANPNFGFLVTESGAGYTWSENSRENRLTPWSNDPVSDRGGEVIYFRDSKSGHYWSPSARPTLLQGSARVIHGFGESEFLTNEQGIECSMTLSGSKSERVKWWHLKIKNRSNEERRLEIFLYLEWVLGVHRPDSVRTLVTNFDKSSSILYATNHYNNEFAGRIVYLGSNLSIGSYTTSREEFIGRHRGTGSPRVLDAAAELKLSNIFTHTQDPIQLSGKLGAGFDSCGVIKVDVNLAPGQERELQFFLGEASTLQEARKDAGRFKSLGFRSSELESVRQQWNALVSTVTVHTPDRAFDILMNGWLLYQTISCRLFARSAYYQSGGAIGFRDQLQDVMAMLYCRPDLARAQIILHASHQFPEGDAQHWWHPPTGRGVRTKISDDFLWLPYVVHRYIEVTGDYSVLDERAPFVTGPKLEAHQMESYLMPQVDSRTVSIYDHCVLALNHGLELGVHGLPLMVGGDWNDGMNEVGKEGKGESVWLAWFLSDCLRKFSDIAIQRKDTSNAERYTDIAKQLVRSIDENAWDGAWYRRAYFDDGSPLGSSQNDECRIDSIAQSWSVICGGGDSERRKVAMESVMRELVESEDRIIKLLTPPFNHGSTEPGYIAGYLPGIRENGGQYTHAAAWVVLAMALQGKGNDAHKLFSMLNPINHSSTKSDALRYKTEPYVVCGDVYSTSPHAGRGGWSWYTGSSGWLYQVGVEYLIGLKVRGNYFTIDPSVPSSWREFSIEYSTRGIRYQIEVTNPSQVERGVVSIEIDGKVAGDKKIPLVADSTGNNPTIKVKVIMGTTLA